MKHRKRSAAFPLLPREDDYCWVEDKKKRKYATRFDAELAAPVRILDQYVCELCGSWHNGNRNGRPKDADDKETD